MFVNALRGRNKPSRPYNRRHAPVLTSLISLWELHQWSSPLPALPSMQSSMTCLCLETSLLMQRSHWHLMSQHFSRKLVSGVSTATTDSVPCIVGLLKPRRCHDVVTCLRPQMQGNFQRASETPWVCSFWWILAVLHQAGVNGFIAILLWGARSTN